MDEYDVVQSTPQQPDTGKRSRLACGLVAIMTSISGLNFGIHNFMLGYTGRGIAQAVISGLNIVGYFISFLLMFILIGYLTIWLHVAVGIGMAIWGVVEGILIFTNKDYRDADGNLLKD